ncbi:MAG TPA: hypothetical protein PLP33_27130 [Leptospiraceae bacterium]|nr:hypothetical protein [Leptospiraceae bacterium]
MSSIIHDINEGFNALNNQKKKKRRNKHEKASHLNKISEYYLDGMSQSNIAKIIGISQSQVSQDLELVRQQWMKETIIDIDIIKAEQLKKIDRIEREMWDCWEKSKRIKKSKVTRGRINQQTGATPGSFELYEEEELGDTKFMDKIQWCISERLKITGGYAPKKIEADVSGKVEVNNLAREEILAMIAAKERPKELSPAPANIQQAIEQKPYIDAEFVEVKETILQQKSQVQEEEQELILYASPEELRLETYLNAREEIPPVSVEGSAQETVIGRNQDSKIAKEMNNMSNMINFGHQEKIRKF